MRVAIYARYSSDNQRDASIADQFRVCREYAQRQGWHIEGEYSDRAVSGATLLRSGFQALMRAALNNEVDVVLAEALDRFSRDQEDTAGLFKRLTFKGVKIVTLADGDITHMHIGFKGAMNALFLKDLAEKTHRGLRGRVENGRSGGGLCYGYRVVKALSGGTLTTGEREIELSEAAIVRRIFTEFSEGLSAKAIAKRLNGEHIPGPMSGAWSPSTIHGNPNRGTGILNNELYIGRLVWNRLRYLKNPETGTRVSRLNPPSAWITKDVPELRIIDDELWQAVKARQAQIRRVHTTGFVRLREPKYLFSGLTKCGTCGGGYILSSRHKLVCFNARNRGTCANTRTITRQDVEARVLAAMRARLLEPKRFARVCERFTQTVNRIHREQRASVAGARRELVAVNHQLDELVDAIAHGLRTERTREKLFALEAKKVELKRQIDAKPAPVLHPSMAETFRAKVAALCAGLAHDDQRDVARQALRGIVDAIVIPPEPEALLQVVGNLGAMLAMAQGRRLTSLDPVAIAGCGGGI